MQTKKLNYTNMNQKFTFKSTLLLAFTLLAFMANAQKKMWSGNSYNFSIDSTLNSSSSILWSVTSFPVGLTAGTAVLSGTRGSSYTNTFTNSTSTSKSCSLSVAETITGCTTTNTLGLEVFATPTFTANSLLTYCFSQATAPGTLNAVVANFADIKSITANSNNFTLSYQLYDNSNSVIPGTSGTLTLAAGSAAVSGTVSLSAGQLTTLYTTLNSQVAGTYTLKIFGFSTPLTPTSSEAGAVSAIVASPITIQSFLINALPVSNPIIAN